MVDEIEPKCTNENGHCWHGEFDTSLVYPPRMPERCCWCGVQRDARARNADEFARNHGKHVQNPYIVPCTSVSSQWLPDWDKTSSITTKTDAPITYTDGKAAL